MKKLKEIRSKIANNKALKIIFTIIKISLYTFLSLLLLVILVQKIFQNNKSIGGVRVFTVASESMKDEYDVGDIIITKSVEPNELKVGDNVTYIGREAPVTGLVITHKLVEIEDIEGTTYYTTKGLSNVIPDPSITYDQIYGKVIYKTKLLSSLARLISNRLVYYSLFMLIGLLVSIEVVSAIFESRREEDADE